MGLGKIIGSISPAFGMLSGKGLFGQLPLQQMGGMGLGGILGMLLSQGGGQDRDPTGGADISGAYPGIDPMLTGQQAPMSNGPRFGNFGGQMYFGGRNPIGQNAIGKFLGGLF